MSDMNEISNALLNELNKELIEKNTLTEQEFSRYIPLFTENGISSMDEYEYRQLGEEWMKRVSIWDKVVIIDPYREGDKVVCILPPVLQRLNEINHIGDNAGRVVDYFVDTLVRDTRFNGERVKSLGMMGLAMDSAQLKNIDSIRKGVEEYIRLRKNIEVRNEGTSDSDNPTEEKVSSSDLVWE